MKITLYFINFNDSFYFKFIQRHYGKFCQRIVMYDNHSTDDSVKIAESLGFEVRPFGVPGMLNDQHYLTVKNKCWKEEQGKGVDYVIVCDADEFVVPYRLGGSAPVVNGFDMISETLPNYSIFEVNTGDPSVSYSKQAIFSPDRVEEIHYVHGCHKHNMIAMPDGEGRMPITRDGVCALYHFRKIGGVDRLIKRHEEYRPRLSEFNVKYKMGFHYGDPKDNPEEIAKAKRADWLEHSTRAIQYNLSNIVTSQFTHL